MEVKTFKQLPCGNCNFNNISGILSIVSLSVAAMVIIMIAFWSFTEYRFDRFHKDSDRIVRVTGQAILYKNLYKYPTDESSIALDERFLASIPQVEDFTFFASDASNKFTVEANGMTYTHIPAITASENFFTFFSFPLKEGDPQTALDTPGKVVIDVTTANKFFPNRSALRQVLTINGIVHVVSGVMADIPRYSHIQTRMVMSNNLEFQATLQIKGIYHKLTKEVDVATLTQTLTSGAHEKVAYLKNLNYQIYLQPLTEIHFGEADFVRDTALKGNKTEVNIYVLVAFAILLLSCYNAAPLIANRVEKSGRHRKGFRETACYTIKALIIGLLMAVLLTPLYNQHTNSRFLIDFTSPNLYVWLIVLFGLITGSIMIFIITSDHPKASYKPSVSVFRKTVTLLQCVAFVALISTTLWKSYHINFMLTQSAGIDRENIIYAYADIQLNEQYENLRQELKKAPAVIDVTTKSELPTEYDFEMLVALSEDEKAFTIEGMYIKSNYFDVMGMQFIKGVNPFDTKGMPFCVLNETAAQLSGLKEPIDKTIYINDKQFIIKGIIRDAQVRSFRKATDPQVYMSMDYWWESQVKVPVMIKINGNAQKAVASIERQWKVVLPETPFDYRSLSETYKQLYASEINLRNTLAYATLISLIMCIAALIAVRPWR